ncbi:hypothetical protein KAW44_07005, partial [Candidatus Bipolaricaulota bacterium]|nr:hypothetical protein [Candidatus Bipolaricaulota bacterium]
AFNGALAAALSEGLPLEDAVRWGAAGGALATTNKGAQPALPTRQAVEDLLNNAAQEQQANRTSRGSQ